MINSKKIIKHEILREISLIYSTVTSPEEEPMVLMQTQMLIFIYLSVLSVHCKTIEQL